MEGLEAGGMLVVGVGVEPAMDHAPRGGGGGGGAARGDAATRPGGGAGTRGHRTNGTRE